MFVIDRAGTNFARLHSFTSDIGVTPSSKLVQQSSNVFYGTLQGSGSCGYGSIYRYSGAGDTVTGNTRCGGTGNNDNGGGAGGPALLLMLGTLLALRRRAR